MPITAKGHKMLASFHGLDPDKNNDDDVAEAIRNAVTPDEVKNLKNRADKAEAALVDQDLVKFANRIGTDEKIKTRWKGLLIANRAETIEMLEALPEPSTTVVDPKGGKQPIHNRANASQPTAIDAPDKTAAEKTRHASLIQNRAKKLQEGGTSMIASHIQASKEITEELAAGMHK